MSSRTRSSQNNNTPNNNNTSQSHQNNDKKTIDNDRRRNNGYSETGVPPGVDLKVHSTVILVGLESERGQRMNGSIAQIVDVMKQGRYPVVLLQDDEEEANNNNSRTNPTTNTSNTTNINWIYIKPTNLRLVCSNPNCYNSHIYHLKQCGDCGIAVYCHEICQLQHWKLKPRENGHKQVCQEWIQQRIEKRRK